SLTTAPPCCLTTRFLNSSTERRLVEAVRFTCTICPLVVPTAERKLFAASALLTSAAVRFYAASWSGSSQARIAKSFPPRMAADRAHVVDAVRLRDGVLERRGDEARDERRVRADVDSGHGHDRVLRARVLQDGQEPDRAQTEHEHGQAHDRREDRPLDENIG